MKRNKFLKSTILASGLLPIPFSFYSCHQNQKKGESEKIISNESKIIKDSQGLELDVRGDRQLLKLTGKDTNGLFTLIEQNNEPGIGVPLHVHENEDEVFQVLSGTIEVSVGDKKAILKKGDMVFCPRGVPHSWTVVGEEKAKSMLSIFPAGLEEMFKEISQLPSGPPDPQIVEEIRRRYKITFL